MTTTDAAIIDFLSDSPQPIRELVGTYPKATLYTRLHILQTKGLVAKHGSQYLLTAAGLQVKAGRREAPVLDGLTEVYPPLDAIPSPQHRAMVELAISALVVRQHTEQEEHHAGFLFFGPPLTWKSAGGRFLCVVAGADPDTCVVDLAAESGRSLWIRRGPAGDIRSQRALLSAPTIVLDEFGLADRAVRQAVAPFICGRRRLPLENEILSITPVPVITMNARPGDTLSGRTGFSLPQLRRLVPCDLSAVLLPDLALEGGRALEAARQMGPLPLRPPRASCEEFRHAVVRLLRQVLVQEAIGNVDVDLVLGLGRGLTVWLTPVAAMRQALYDFLLAVETVKWTQPRWLEAIRTFPESREDAGPTSAMALRSVTDASVLIRRPKTISLFPERIAPKSPKEHSAMNPRESMMPSFAMTDRSKSLLVWLTEDAQAPSLDQVVEILVDIYRMQRLDDVAFQDLLAVVRLREACGLAEISLDDLRTAVELRAGLTARGLNLDHIESVLRVAEDLVEAGLSLKEAVGVADLMKAMKKAGIDPRVPDHLEATLRRYATLGYDPKSITRLAALSERLGSIGLGLGDLDIVLDRLGRLSALGLDGDVAETLVIMLGLAGVAETQRGAVLATAVELGKMGITLVDARADEQALQEQVQQLRDEQAALQGDLAARQDELVHLREKEDQAQAGLAALRDEATLHEDAITAARALEGFLLSNSDATDQFFAKVAVVLEIRRRGSPHGAALEAALTTAAQHNVLKFLNRISTLKETT